MRHRAPRLLPTLLRRLLPAAALGRVRRATAQALSARPAVPVACGLAAVMAALGALLVAAPFDDDTVAASDAPAVRSPATSGGERASRAGGRTPVTPSTPRSGTSPSAADGPDSRTPEETPRTTSPAPRRSVAEATTPSRGDARRHDRGLPVQADRLTGTPSTPEPPTTTPSARRSVQAPSHAPSPARRPTSPATHGDASAPETTLDSGPPQRDSSAEAEFSFHADETATYTCSLDGGAYSPCSPGTEYSGLTPGWHDFAVRARDAAGNVDASPATWRWHTTARD